MEQISAVQGAGRVMTQADGAVVHILEQGGRFNVVVSDRQHHELSRRDAQGLKIAYRAGLDDATRAMRSHEGVYADSESEARQFAQKWSTLNHGGGDTVRDSAQPGKYPRYHALDSNGDRLPGHAWFGKLGSFLFAVFDVDGDGEFTFMDVLKSGNPTPFPLKPCPGEV